MPIKVNISLSAGGRFKPVASHTFHDKLVTIGRDRECTLTLEDTQKLVSRMHAEIETDTDGYWIKVVSKVNPIAVNGKKFSYGDRVRVVEGDQVSVGLYKLEIMEAEVAPVRAKAPAARPPAPDVSDEATVAPAAKAPPAPDPAPKRENPEARLGAIASAPRAAPPKADIGKETDEEEATYVPPAAPTPSPVATAAPPARTPLPDNPIADDEVTYIPPMWAKLASRTASLSPSGGAPDSSEDLTHVGRQPPKAPEAEPPAPATQASSVDLDFDLTDAFDAPAPAKAVPAAPPPPAPAPAARTASPLVRPPPNAPDVEEGFSEDVTYVRRSPPKPVQPASPPAKPPQAAKPAPTADDLAEEETQYRPSVAPSRSAPPAAKAAPGTGTDAERAVAAFLDGAGLSNLRVTDAERFMRDSGVMVRAAVEGVMMLLLAREEARRQMGAEATNSADDNPIKSMSNPDEVIAFLFDPKRPAIADVDPVQAFSEACSDLRAHQVALFEGMRAAIMTALLRLDPKKLEREQGSSLGLLNITRKSKLWELSMAQHEQLAHEIEEDFAKVFGAEILTAYNLQVRKTRGG